MNEHPIAAWHRIIETRSPQELSRWLADDAVFHSPIVHTPQRGKALVSASLSAAFEVLANEHFRYVREIVGPSDALL